MRKKIGVVSLGCPKNLVDTEAMLGLLERDGYEITNEERNADIIIVNTCGFIDKAKQESIDAILEMGLLKQDKLKTLIVTGCMAERYKDEIIKEMPEVDAVLGTGNYGGIAEVIKEAEGGEKPVICDHEAGLEHLEGERILSGKSGYAYLKIAEGCSNRCTYCVIPSLRGPFRSRSFESVLGEAKRLAKAGIKELILVAQDTTRYGTDFAGKSMLADLVKALSEIDGIEWIRLLYCYPDEINEELISEFKNNKKLCKYIDIPIQHISDRILKLMGRRGTGEDVRKLLVKLREEVPDIYIRTSLITGFPSEDEEDFSQMMDFLREFRLDRVGVFTYSREEGTPAAAMKKQVSSKIKKQRYESLMELQNNISAEKNAARVGTVCKTLVESVAEDGIFYKGRTYAEAPEIDGMVYFTSQEPLSPGQFVDIKILLADEYDITGEVKK